MRTHLLAALLFAGVVGLGIQAPAQAQDKITYRDRATGKETVATGTIQSETADRLVIKGTTSREVPAVDVIDVTYTVPGALKLDYARLGPAERNLETLTKEEERKKALADLIKNYQELGTKATGDSAKFLQRQIQFKIAQLRARQAEDDPEQLTAALEALQKFVKDHPDSWQVSSAAKLLARLQIVKGDTDAAQKTYQALAALPNVPKEVKQECDLLGAQALLEGKKYDEAKKRLEALQKSVPAGDPQAVRVQVYLAACLAGAGDLTKAVPQIEGIIAKTSDNALKATAYNALGDCYRLNGRPKEALWAYLWVDVLYHQDKQEHTKAMSHLAKLFEELGDSARAAQFKDKLKKEGR